MDDGRVVASAELFPDGRIGDREFLTQDIHDDLPWLNHFLFPRFLVDAFLGDFIVLGDTAHHFFHRNAFIGAHIVLNERPDIRQ